MDHVPCCQCACWPHPGGERGVLKGRESSRFQAASNHGAILRSLRREEKPLRPPVILWSVRDAQLGCLHVRHSLFTLRALLFLERPYSWCMHGRHASQQCAKPHRWRQRHIKLPQYPSKALLFITRTSDATLPPPSSSCCSFSSSSRITMSRSDSGSSPRAAVPLRRLATPIEHVPSRPAEDRG